LADLILAALIGLRTGGAVAITHGGSRRSGGAGTSDDAGTI
jgi:hypothetical protein